MNNSEDNLMRRLAQSTINRAQALWDFGKTEQALKDFQEAYETAPDLAGPLYSKAIYQIGIQKQDTGDLEDALKDFLFAAQIAPESDWRKEIQHTIDTLERKLYPPEPEPETEPVLALACPNCGREVQTKWEFCPYCSTGLKPPVPVSSTECPQCGKQIQPEWEFCPNCSYQIRSTSNVPVLAPTLLPNSKLVPLEPLPVTPFHPLSTLPVGAEILKSPAISARPQDKKTTQPKAASGPKIDQKIALILVCGILMLLLIFIVGISLLLEPSRSSILALIYSPTPTSTPTVTPNYQATNSAATSIASTATSTASTATASARLAAEIAQASATSSAQTATAVADALTQAVVQICLGKGEPRAARYVAKRAFHPICIYPFTYDYPNEARPQGLDHLELVACVQNSAVKIRSTSYTGYLPYTSYQCNEWIHTAKIILRAAQTGEIIRVNDVLGPTPTPCGDTEIFSNSERTKTYSGGLVSSTQIWDQIKDLVYLELKSVFIDNHAVFAINLRVLP